MMIEKKQKGVLRFDLFHLSFLVGGDEDENDGGKAAEKNLRKSVEIKEENLFFT